MRRVLALVLAMVLVGVLVLPASAAVAPRVLVDGVELAAARAADNAGDLLVPAGALAEALGAQFTVHPSGKSIALVNGLYSAELQAANRRAVVNGAVHWFDIAPVQSGEDLLVPAGAVAAALGTLVDVDSSSQTVSIFTGKGLLRKALARQKEPLADQKTSGTIGISFTLKAPDFPGGHMAFSAATEFTAHMYQKDMLATYSTKLSMPELADATAEVMQMAVRNGTGFMRNNDGPWLHLGQTDLQSEADLNEFVSLGVGMPSSPLGDDMLEHMNVTVTGTKQVEGRTLATLRLTMASDDFRQAMAAMVADQAMMGEEAPAGSLEEELGTFELPKYDIVYTIDPATGFIYHMHMDMTVKLSAPPGQEGELSLTTKGDMQASPVSEPIDFPTDLPQ